MSERSPTLEEFLASATAAHRTQEDSVTSTIRNAISAGVFRPGERLPQDRLAGLLDVSRQPVRSALRQLESEGLVEFHPHRGATVRELGPAEIADLYEVRSMLETFALRRTAAAVTERDLAEIEDLLDRLESATNPVERFAARQEFYDRLYAVGNTRRVVATIGQLRAEMGHYAQEFTGLDSRQHRELLARIRAGDPAAAAAWLEAHLREVADGLQRQLAATTSAGTAHDR